MVQTSDLSNILSGAFEAVFRRARRSLVVVQSGRRGAGAGIIWRQGGIIVTNYHVIQRGRPFVALLEGMAGAGDRGYPARVVAAAPEIDLAVLQVDLSSVPSEELSVAPIADSRGLRVGQIALAIGHPWGQLGAVSLGVITGLGEVQVDHKGTTRWAFLKGKSIEVIRSDVHLAPGNSGSPLMNAAGGVVGVNTMIVGGDLGIAIPSHVVNAFVEEALRVDSPVLTL